MLILKQSLIEQIFSRTGKLLYYFVSLSKEDYILTRGNEANELCKYIGFTWIVVSANFLLINTSVPQLETRIKFQKEKKK